MDTSYDQQDVVREYELLSANRRPRISIFNSSYLIHSKEYAQGKKKKYIIIRIFKISIFEIVY